jgi:sigma-E factor negative regulatory protein RseB
MSAAIKTLNYEGVFVYIHGKQMETMLIVHSNTEGVEKERLLSLAGAPREILRNNDRLVCILPDSQSVVVEKSRPKNYLPTGFQHVTSELKRYYNFSVVGKERMTGRQATVIEVHPKDPYRYGYQLWLDEDTGMLLKSDLVNENGEAVEQIMFTEINIKDEIPDEQLEPTISSQGYKWFKQDEQTEVGEIKDSQWEVMRLPAGYMQGMHETHGLPTSRMPVEHLMFTDGISSVSVYIEEMSKSKPMMKGFSQIGAVNAYTTIMSSHYVTVVGEVPKSAVKLIADSVRYKAGR